MHALMQTFFDRLSTKVGLDETESAAIASCCSEVISVGADIEIIPQGSEPDRLHLLLEGWAYRYVLLPDGRRHISTLLLAGDFCDLDALRVKRLKFGVATLGACRIAGLSRTALHGVMERHPRVAQAFLSLAIAENEVLTRWNLSLGRQTAKERLAFLFCELVFRLLGSDHSDPESKIVFPINQSELGDVLGLSTVHVNRVLQDLRARKLIELCSDELRILDWKGLASLAYFAASYLSVDGENSPRPMAVF